MRFWFQVWWVTGGTWSAETHGADTLGECQRLWTSWERAVGRWPDTVTACGLSRIGCPQGGPWPRDGEAGRDDVLVRSPEQEDAA